MDNHLANMSLYLINYKVLAMFTSIFRTTGLIGSDAVIGEGRVILTLTGCTLGMTSFF